MTRKAQVEHISSAFSGESGLSMRPLRRPERRLGLVEASGHPAVRAATAPIRSAQRVADGARSMRRLNSDKSSSAKSRRAPDKSSSAKSACASSSPGKTPPECDVGLLGRVLNDPFLRNLSTHTIEERVDALMVALNRCAGPMHLKQARKDLQCQNRHEKTPQKRLRPRC